MGARVMYWSGGDSLNNNSQLDINLGGSSALCGNIVNPTAAKSLHKTAGTYTKLTIHISSNTSNQPATFKFMIDEVPGNMSITIPAGATGIFQDSSNQDVTVGGEYLAYQLLNTAFSTGNIVIRGVGCLFQASGGETVYRMLGSVGVASALGFGVTRYFTPLGAWVSQFVTQSNANTHLNFAGTVRNAAVNMRSNTLNGASTATLMKNNVATGIVITIPAGTSGWFEDTVNEVDFVAGDFFDWKLVTGGSSGSIFPAKGAMDVVTSSFIFPCGSSQGPENTGAGITTYPNCQGTLSPDASEATFPVYSIQSNTYSGMGIQITGNTLNGATTLRFRVGGVDGNQNITIDAGQTGYFHDDSNQDTVITGQDATVKMVVGGSTGQIFYSVIDFSVGSPISPASGIYKIVPDSHKTNDTLWTNSFADTEDVKIPDPLIRTYGVP